MNRQQFEAALGKFQRACVLDPKSDVPCLNMGIAFVNMQRYDDARRVLAKSAELDPMNPRAWFNLGLIDKAEGKGGRSDHRVSERSLRSIPTTPTLNIFLAFSTRRNSSIRKPSNASARRSSSIRSTSPRNLGSRKRFFAPATKTARRSTSTASST